MCLYQKRLFSSSSLGNDESYNFSVVGVGAGGGGREVVTALRAWVQYAVAVRAYNAHGAGPVSPPVVVRTLEDGKENFVSFLLFVLLMGNS